MCKTCSEPSTKTSTEIHPGDKYNELTVIRKSNVKTGSHFTYECQCSCGNKTYVRGYYLISGHTKSCGHCKELKPGDVYGYLTVLKKLDDRYQDGCILYECQCVCGKIVICSGRNLRIGHTKSCGCSLRSSGEKAIAEFLKANNISYIQEYKLTELSTPKGGTPRIDFVIHYGDSEFIFIEYQGEQHYIEKKGRPDFGKLQREITDPMKRAYCIQNNIPLYEIRYDEDTIGRLIEILTEIGLLDKIAA